MSGEFRAETLDPARLPAAHAHSLLLIVEERLQ